MQGRVKLFILSTTKDYYPYGEILRSYITGSNVNDKYKFTEKERDTETNYDYGVYPDSIGSARYGVYPDVIGNSDLGRWLSIDPLADKTCPEPVEGYPVYHLIIIVKTIH